MSAYGRGDGLGPLGKGRRFDWRRTTPPPPRHGFTVGDEVQHVSFGGGTVVAVESDSVIAVRFNEDGAVRRLLAGVAPLAPLKAVGRLDCAGGSANVPTSVSKDAGEISGSSGQAIRQSSGWEGEIRSVVAQRAIKELVHFTRLDNVASILRLGLLSQEELQQRGVEHVVNDLERFDHQLLAVCVSISFPNYKMFYKYRCREAEQAWVVLALEPEVLWRFDCAFCIENAASSKVLRIPLEHRKTPDALRQVFADHEGYPLRAQCGLSVSQPTHPQAEVLVFDSIPSACIASIDVNGTAAAGALVDLGYRGRVTHGRFFGYRSDWGLWPPAAQSD